MDKAKVGLIGCGMISDIYLKNLTEIFSGTVEVVAVADINLDNARQKGERYGINDILTPEELLVRGDIETVLNLTVPKAHYEVNTRILESGKNLYVEKPLAGTYAQGKALQTLAAKKKVWIAGAPDTFMGASLQTAIKAINDGLIGKPLAATGFMTCHGWEEMHPNPDFYYAKGGGPMFDMGPYYLTALVAMLGPARTVCAMASQKSAKRPVMIGPRKGEWVPVEIPTHITGNIRFASGVIASMITSFDVWETDLPYIQIYGTDATLVVPDPDKYAGKVLLCTSKAAKMEELPLANPFDFNSRGLGLTDMVEAMKTGRRPRCDVSLTGHVLEIMEAFHSSNEKQQFIKLESTCERPAPFLPASLPQ